MAAESGSPSVPQWTAVRSAALAFFQSLSSDKKRLAWVERFIDRAHDEQNEDQCAALIDTVIRKMDLPLPSVRRARAADPSLKHFFKALTASDYIGTETHNKTAERLAKQMFQYFWACSKTIDQWFDAKPKNEKSFTKEEAEYDEEKMRVFEDLVRQEHAGHAGHYHESHKEMAEGIKKWFPEFKEREALLQKLYEKDSKTNDYVPKKEKMRPRGGFKPKMQLMRPHMTDTKIQELNRLRPNRDDYLMYIQFILYFLPKKPTKRHPDKYAGIRAVLRKNSNLAAHLAQEAGLLETDDYNTMREIERNAIELANDIVLISAGRRGHRFVSDEVEDPDKKPGKPHVPRLTAPGEAGEAGEVGDAGETTEEEEQESELEEKEAKRPGKQRGERAPKETLDDRVREAGEKREEAARRKALKRALDKAKRDYDRDLNKAKRDLKKIGLS